MVRLVLVRNGAGNLEVSGPSFFSRIIGYGKG
jgi:hypothetical protein